MDTKVAFDTEAFAKEHGMTIEFLNWFFDKKKEGCGTVWFMMCAAMWEGWKGSREELEIEFPEEYHSDSWLGNGCCDDYANTKIAECRKVILSHGIRIKE